MPEFSDHVEACALIELGTIVGELELDKKPPGYRWEPGQAPQDEKPKGWGWI